MSLLRKKQKETSDSEKENDTITGENEDSALTEAFSDGEADSAGAGSSLASATAISLNSTYTGSLTSTNKTDSYQFTLPSSGRINLTSIARSMKYVYYRIYDESGNQLWYANKYWNSTTEQTTINENFDLTKGVYYFVMERDGYDGTYSFSLDFTSAGESFSETNGGNNNSLPTADNISVNKQYKGQIAKNDEKDFYCFSLSSSGKIVLKASASMKYIYYRIYDESGNQLWYKNAYWNSTTERIDTEETIELTKGTYYLAAERDGHTGNYSFKLQFTSADESFTETNGGTNNSIETANRISANTTYKGQIAINDDKDFYRFTVNKSSDITVSATAWMKYIYYRIYNSSGDEIWHKNSYWKSETGKSTVSEKVTLSAGTYYFCVNKDYNYGNYKFSLNYGHSHQYKNYITKATTSTNGKIVRKCSCGSIASTKVLYSPKTLKLSATKYTYNGKTRTPSVTVLDSAGKTISSSNYSISLSAGRRNVGTYKVKVTFKGSYYSGSLTASYNIVPKGTTISRLSAGYGAFTANVKAQKTQISGYQIYYRAQGSSNAVIQTFSGNTRTALTISGLYSYTRYYVYVRTYKVVSGKVYYSSWSGAKAITTK